SVQPRAARRPSDEGGLLLCGRRRSQSSGGEGSKQEGRGVRGRRRRAGRGRRVRWPRSSRGCRGRGLQAPGPSTPRLLGGRSPRPREKGISEYFRVCSAAGTAPTPARVSSVMFPLHCSSSTTLLHSKDRTTRPRKAPTDLLPSAPSGGGPPRARRAPRAPSER
ncbi:unnamed protein product, partial [Prorocentrum cordatum]